MQITTVFACDIGYKCHMEVTSLKMFCCVYALLQMMGDVFSALTAAVGAADKVLELIHRCVLACDCAWELSAVLLLTERDGCGWVSSRDLCLMLCSGNVFFVLESPASDPAFACLINNAHTCRRPEIAPEGTLVPAVFEGSVELRDVYFSYPARPQSQVCEPGFLYQAETTCIAALYTKPGSFT